MAVPGLGRALVTLATVVALLGGSSSAAAADGGFDAVCQAANCPTPSQVSVLSFPAAVRDGYALITGRGTTVDFGAAQLRSSPGGAVTAVSTANGRGLWTVSSRGVVRAFGSAPGYGSFRGLLAGDRVVAMARTGDSRGYWLITSRGVLEAFGDARAWGTVVRLAPGDHVVAIAGAPGGYLIATADGAVRAFGRARAYGSWDVGHAHGAVVAMAEAPHGNGYWLAARNGEVKAFGLVRPYGSVRHLAHGDRVVSIAMTPGGGGYMVASARGAVHGFGAARRKRAQGGSGRGAVGVVIADTPAANPAATSLKVRLLSLRPGQRGRITIAGPDGYRLSTGRSVVLEDVTPGTWRITARPVPDRSGSTRYPEYTTTIVHLGSGARASVPISYGEVVNNGTAVASGGALRTLHQSAGVYTLTINDPTHALHAGSALSLGVGPLTPAGLLLKLRAVTHDGAIATATGATATLSDIGPQGTINVATSLSTPPPAAGAARAARAASAASAASAAEDPGNFDKPYTCSGGTSASVSGGVSFSSNVSVGASWGGFWHPLTVTAHFEVDGLEQSKLTLTVAGQASCSYDQDLLKDPIKFTSIKFFIGPVPVVIVPTLNFTVSADGSVGGSLTTHVTQSIGIGAGLNYDKHISPIGWFTDSFSYTPFQPSVTASLSGAIGPELAFLIDDVAGPYLSADGTVGVKVDTAKSPWWQITGGLEVGVGVKFHAFDHEFDWGIPDVLSHSWTIAQAASPPPPLIINSTLPNGVVGSAYQQTAGRQRGVSPFHWTVSAGALPPGLSLNSSAGVVSGTPTNEGTYTFTLKVVDNANQSATQVYTVVITSPPPVLGPQTLPGATAGQAYSATLTASSGAPPYQWAVTSPTLAGGLTLGAATGTISGTPLAAGVFTFIVTVTDHAGHSANRSFTVTVAAPATPEVTTPSLPAGIVDQPYSATLTASGGTSPYTWSLTGGALPAGLTLDPGTGAISGTPTTSGTQSITFTATDAHGTPGSTQLPVTVVNPTFQQANPATSPPARNGGAMAYDPSTDQLIMFGGRNNGSDLGDTWLWSGTTWTQLSPATSPSARHQASIAYDPTIHELVLFGGYSYSGGVYHNDTWTWNGTTWTLLNPATSPPARQGAPMAFDADPGVDQLVLFGGVSSSAVLNDTWEFDGTNWAQVSTGSGTPTAMQIASMAYDPSSDQVVLFGGINSNGSAVYNTTYTFDGSTWTALSPSASPLPRWGAALAYNPVGDDLALFAGAGSSGFAAPYYDDTWTWNATTWTQVTPVPASPASAYPQSRIDPMMAYDADTSQVVLFGGQASSGSGLNDTWIYLGP